MSIRIDMSFLSISLKNPSHLTIPASVRLSSRRSLAPNLAGAGVGVYACDGWGIDKVGNLVYNSGIKKNLSESRNI